MFAIMTLCLFQVPTSANSLRVAIVEDFAPCIIKSGESYTGLDLELLGTMQQNGTLPYQRFEYLPMHLDQALEAIEHGEADIALGGITITSQRERLIDFSHPYAEAGLRLLVREKVDVSYWDLICRILGTTAIYQVLISLLVFLAVCAHIIWMIERHRNRETFPRGYFRGVTSACYYVFICITTVGFGDKVCRSAIGKGLTCVIIFIGLIFYGSITGSFAAAFTQAYSGKYPELHDLTTVATKHGSTAHTYLKSALKDSDTELRVFTSINDAYRELNRGKVEGVLFDGPNIHHNAGKWMTTPIHYTDETYGIAIAPNRPNLREAINAGILQLHESGELDRLQNRWVK